MIFRCNYCFALYLCWNQFCPYAGIYGSEKNPYPGIFYAVCLFFFLFFFVFFFAIFQRYYTKSSVKPNEVYTVTNYFTVCFVEVTLPEKCPYSELLWSVFSCLQSKCRKMRTRITPNTDTFYAVWFISLT